MSKRIQRIKKLQEVLDVFLDNTEKLLSLIDEETEKDFKNMLHNFLTCYASFNYYFAIYLLKKFPQSVKSDIIDEKFRDLMKPLEEEFKRKKGKNGK